MHDDDDFISFIYFWGILSHCQHINLYHSYIMVGMYSMLTYYLWSSWNVNEIPFIRFYVICLPWTCTWAICITSRKSLLLCLFVRKSIRAHITIIIITVIKWGINTQILSNFVFFMYFNKIWIICFFLCFVSRHN